MADDETVEMLLTNRRQKAYYDVASGFGTEFANNTITNLWRWLKIRALTAFDLAERAKSIDALHLSWVGDISRAKVLDLGCGSGNALSVHLAQASKEYVAVDFSEVHLQNLQHRLNASGIRNATLKAVDFLSTEFSDSEFDLIYARSVLHHFKHLEKLMDHLESKLRPGGRIITYDPIQVWRPIKIARALVRPWQTDAEWEYPFDATALRAIEARFVVLDRRGIWGRSKWASIIGLVAPNYGSRFATSLHAADMKNNTTPRSVRGCLQIAYHLKRRD